MHSKEKIIKQCEQPHTYKYLKSLYQFLCESSSLKMEEWLRMEFDSAFIGFRVFKEGAVIKFNEKARLLYEGSNDFYVIPEHYSELTNDIIISTRLYNLILDGYISREFDETKEGAELKKAMEEERDKEDLILIKRDIINQIRYERLHKQAMNELKSEGYDIAEYLQSLLYKK